MVSTTTNSGQ